MTDRQIGMAVRALRLRREWTQAELGRRAGCSGSSVSRLERGKVRLLSLAVIRRVLEALDAWVFTKVIWRGGELDRLLDADHALLRERWAKRKAAASADWIHRQEVTYNEHGDRGAIDDLAFHPPTGTLLVTELKTAIYDTQATVAKLDEKTRVAPIVARRFGWQARRVVACLVVAEGRTNRRRIEEHPTVFAHLDCGGRSASAWLRDPSKRVGGLLVFERLSDGQQVHGRRVGRQRVRRRTAR